MATSLVSTGVQFPDSTIQTTAAGAGGLTLISSTSISPGSSAANFLSSFSSTYDDYIVYIDDYKPSANSNLYLQFATGGSADTGSNYGFVVLGANSTFGGTPGYIAQNSDTQINMNYGVTVGTAGTSFSLLFQNVNSTNYKSVSVQALVFQTYATSNVGNAVYKAANTASGFTIWPTSATISSGTVRIYGVQKS